MNQNEEKLLSMIRHAFKQGNHHYNFDIPTNEDEAKNLLTALRSLQGKAYLVIIASPEDGYDYIEVELLPSCCRPSSKK